MENKYKKKVAAAVQPIVGVFIKFHHGDPNDPNTV